MKIVSYLGACLIILSAATDSSQAQTRRPYPAGDTNRDGSVSLDEYVAYARADFARIDRNRDGKLTLAEGRAAAKTAKVARDARKAGQPVFE